VEALPGGWSSEAQTCEGRAKVQPCAAMGLPPGLSYDNVEELIEALEGPLHK